MVPAWVVVGEAAGRLEAEILRGMLESLGLQVRLSQESAAAAYGLALGPLGRVELLVPPEEEAAARAALDDYFAGKNAEADPADEPSGD